MSDPRPDGTPGPRPGDDAEPVADGTPGHEELARLAVAGNVRRAPRYRAWVGSGLVVGLVMGIVIPLALGGRGGPVAVALTGALAAGVGALVGALAAITAERAGRR